MKLYNIRDGVFTLNKGQPASNLLGYDNYVKTFLAWFDHVVMMGRLFPVEDPTTKPVCGPNTTFISFPGYHGPIGFIKAFPRILATIFRTIDPHAAYILRAPATIPALYAVALYLRGIPFAVEVVGNPHDGFSKKALNNNPFGPIFQKMFVALTRWECRAAVATSYVTNHTLQKLYPTRNPNTAFGFTDIDLHAKCFVDVAKSAADFESKVLNLVLIGNMQGNYKGHDVLLHTIAKLHQDGIKTHTTIIGFGDNQPLYEELAKTLGIANAVTFTGKLANGEPIWEILDKSHIFILPSRQEGLPRALLEAMARGLPAIATRVGGTPELLDSQCIVESDDVDGLAERIKTAWADKRFLASQSERNLDEARTYRIEVVASKRKAFYDLIKKSVLK